MRRRLCLQALLDISEAIGQMDGADRVVKVSGEQKIVRERYRLPASVRLVLARNLSTLKPYVDAYVAARNALITQIAGGGNTIAPNDSEGISMYAEAHRELVAQSVEIDLEPLDTSDLNLDDNPVPPAVLAALAPLGEAWQVPRPIALRMPSIGAPHGGQQ